MGSWPQSGDRLLPFLLAALLLHGAMLYAVSVDLPAFTMAPPSVTVLDIALELAPMSSGADSSGPVSAQTESRPDALHATEVPSAAARAARSASHVDAVTAVSRPGAPTVSLPSQEATRAPAASPPPPRKAVSHRAPPRNPRPAVETLPAETPASAASSGSVLDAGPATPPDRPRVTSALLDRQISEWTASYTESRTRESAMPARTAYVTQVTSHRYAADAYERSWQDKVERVGNLNYPEEARRKNLSGGLLLTVGVNADGSLKGINVVKSSGHGELDEAAVRIVRLAAPFAPFPSQLKADYDVLVITRTWRFFSDHHLSTAP